MFFNTHPHNEIKQTTMYILMQARGFEPKTLQNLSFETKLKTIRPKSLSYYIICQQCIYHAL